MLSLYFYPGRKLLVLTKLGRLRRQGGLFSFPLLEIENFTLKQFTLYLPDVQSP